MYIFFTKSIELRKNELMANNNDSTGKKTEQVISWIKVLLHQKHFLSLKTVIAVFEGFWAQTPQAVISILNFFLAQLASVIPSLIYKSKVTAASALQECMFLFALSHMLLGKS